jgi:chorismate dehydratase
MTLPPASLAQGKPHRPGPVRLGAVSYLNTKPLVEGLDARPDLFSVRYDVPSVCAALLHAGDVDLGLIPAVEYQRGDGTPYWIVPDLAIGSNGPIASVAVFSRVPVERIRSMALDTSSRTSVALTRILCARHWDIEPAFVPAGPDLTGMLGQADAALLIGDPALVADPAAHDALKLDLGSEWQAMTGLPFVYAVWAGREGAISPAHVRALQEARDRGVSAVEAIARREGEGDPVAADRALRYLRDNLKYGLKDAEIAGLRRFHALAAELHLVEARRDLRFYL